MSKPAILLIGAGGHARSCVDVIEMQGDFEIGGLVGTIGGGHVHLIGNKQFIEVGTDRDLPNLAKRYQYALIAVGQIKTSKLRSQLFQMAIDIGFQLPVVVSPSSQVSRHAILGPGTIAMHGAIINAGVVIGSNCIINSRALIEHDAFIGNHCHISTGAILNGGVEVGQGSFIGSGSVVKQGLKIGSNCVVGMGVAVRSNLDNQKEFVGNNNV